MEEKPGELSHVLTGDRDEQNRLMAVTEGVAAAQKGADAALHKGGVSPTPATHSILRVLKAGETAY